MTVTDQQFNNLANQVTQIQGTVNGIDTELGVDPQGVYADVRTRLDVLETRIGSVSNISFGGDLEGTFVSQTLVAIQGVHIYGSTPATTGEVLVWDASFNGYDIRQLTQDDILPSFTISSFSGGSTVEIGASVSNPAFTASYNRTPNSAQITNTDGIDSPLLLSSPFTSGTVVGSFSHNTQTSVVFTLTAVESASKTATSSLNFYPRSFGGVGSAGATGATTSGNNALLSTGNTIDNLGLFSSDTGQTFGPFSPSNQKVYLLLTGGSHTFKDANTGFAFPFLAPTSVAFVNQNSATVSMYLYESQYLLSATYSISVVS